MKPPSKRTVRDAIRILGYAISSGRVFCWQPDDAEVRLLIYKSIWSDEVRGDLDDCDPTRRLAARLAIAENLLREGWLP